MTTEREAVCFLFLRRICCIIPSVSSPAQVLDTNVNVNAELVVVVIAVAEY